jgi:hypothetical protein
MVKPSLVLVPLLVPLEPPTVWLVLLLAADDDAELPLPPHAATERQPSKTRTAEARADPIMRIPFTIDTLLAAARFMRKRPPLQLSPSGDHSAGLAIWQTPRWVVGKRVRTGKGGSPRFQGSSSRGVFLTDRAP